MDVLQGVQAAQTLRRCYYTEHRPPSCCREFTTMKVPVRSVVRLRKGRRFLTIETHKDEQFRLFRFLHTGLIGFDVGVGSFIVRPELLRLLKQGNNRDANQDDLALAV